MIVVCDRCEQPMAGPSCLPQPLSSRTGQEPYARRDEPCPDCGARPEGYHHTSCLIARCTVCGDQWPMCEGWDHEAQYN